MNEPEPPNAGRVRMVRRTFLAGLGLALGGLALAAVAEEKKKPAATDASLSRKTAAAGDGFRPNLFVYVAPDDTVSIVCARSEMGQGVRSSLPALIADELGADLSRIKIVQADGDAAYGDQNTDGSNSVRGFYDDLRRVGAVARTLLVAVAARRFGASPEECDARNGAVVHTKTGRSLAFGALANDAAKLPLPDPSTVRLRPASALQHVGRELPLVDAPDIVTGRAIYGADIVLPGLLTAVVLRPPVLGGRVASFGAARALAVPGVKQVVPIETPSKPYAFHPVGGLAVVANGTWAALRGRAALDVEWEAGDNGGYDSKAYREELTRSASAPGKVVRRRGDVEAALASAASRVEATYYAPHLAHATMEPPCAVAKVEGDRCEVWASTQNPQAARKEVASALGFEPDAVTVHVTLLGGGFGRKSKPDYVVEAALIARAAGAPVRLQWTREDDIRHDYYHSVSVQQLTAGFDARGALVAWRQRTAFPPIGSTLSGATFAAMGELQQGVLDVPVTAPNVQAENGEAYAHTRIGWYRSVANVYHAFAVQSFVDELAHARGKDPLDMQLEIIGPPRLLTKEELGDAELPNYGQSLERYPIDTARHRAVLERVAELSGFRDRRRNGRALGIAVHRSFLTYVAVVISVVRRPDGRIHADEAWICADAGIIVNMERVRSQFEGAVVFALSHALYGEITMKNGATEQANFRDYRLMRIKDAPRAIHVEVLESDKPPGGVGEPGVPPVAPALASAVFALTGQRIRELPLARSIAV
jgi:isoquinoline 1-oxidoreductase beta subunit